MYGEFKPNQRFKMILTVYLFIFCFLYSFILIATLLFSFI